MARRIGMDALTLILFVAGIGLLLVGAEGLVRGASRLAATVGISPLVIGLTVVALGTSSPELAVSVSSAMSGDADIAVGNVVGSNIFNVLFILGLAAIITPLVVSQQLVRLDVPIMIGVSALLLVLSIGGNLNRFEGILLFALLALYTGWALVKSRKESQAVKAEYAEEFSERDETGGSLIRDVIFIAAGLGMLILGSEWFVDGAVELAESMGVSQLVIGLTVVSAGTSMPEVATSVLASLRGERDIAVGNVVGSNIFNILGVLGLTSIVASGGVDVADAALRFDIPFMLAVAIACLPIFFRGLLITRWNGVVFFLFYAAYTLYLILDSSGHDSVRAYGLVMWGLAGPLTAITIIWLAFRAYREHGWAGRAAEPPSTAA